MLTQQIFVTITQILMMRCQKRPNIVLIVADDLGWADVPWRDPSIPAPTLQHLASSGMILNQSYVQQVCTPSRAALLTGLPDKTFYFYLKPQIKMLLEELICTTISSL